LAAAASRQTCSCHSRRPSWRRGTSRCGRERLCVGCVRLCVVCACVAAAGCVVWAQRLADPAPCSPPPHTHTAAGSSRSSSAPRAPNAPPRARRVPHFTPHTRRPPPPLHGHARRAASTTLAAGLCRPQSASGTTSCCRRTAAPRSACACRPAKLLLLLQQLRRRRAAPRSALQRARPRPHPPRPQRPLRQQARRPRCATCGSATRSTRCWRRRLRPTRWRSLTPGSAQPWMPRCVCLFVCVCGGGGGGVWQLPAVSRVCLPHLTSALLLPPLRVRARAAHAAAAHHGAPPGVRGAQRHGCGHL
jgi:hypothetical protein